MVGSTFRGIVAELIQQVAFRRQNPTSKPVLYFGAREIYNTLRRSRKVFVDFNKTDHTSVPLVRTLYYKKQTVPSNNWSFAHCTDNGLLDSEL